MKKFFNKKQKQAAKYTPQAITKMAEDDINNKLNALANWMETQDKKPETRWTYYHTYVIFNTILEKDVLPNLKGRALKKAKQALEIITVETK